MTVRTDWYRHFADQLWLKPDDVGAEEAAFIRHVLGLRRGDEVLDAPCGAGRIAIHLARAGCRVTGVDLNRGFIARARRRFRSEGRSGRFCIRDLRELAFQQAFDGACVWFGSFGYFPDADNAQVLARLARALRPGGRLLIDQPNRERLLRTFLETFATERYTLRSRWCARRQRVETRWTMHGKGPETAYRMSMRLYTSGQLARLFTDAGLEIVARFGSPEGESYRRGSNRLIVVGRKP